VFNEIREQKAMLQGEVEKSKAKLANLNNKYISAPSESDKDA